MTLPRHRTPYAGYVRAAGRAPLALYDPVMAVAMRERTFRGRLLAQLLERDDAGAGPAIVVDVGCGTGSFAVKVAATGAGGATADAGGAASSAGRLRVVGVDGDPGALARARRKRGAAAVEWREGLADALPLADGEADHVVLSLLLHHLSPAGQRAALAEARRVLRPGGRVHVADWGPPRDPLMRAGFRTLQLFDGVENTAPLGRGELPAMLAAGGFEDIRLRDRLRTTWGVLELRCATHPR